MTWMLESEEAVARLGDRALYLEVGRYFLRLLPQTREEMRTALQAGDLRDLQRLSHSLKSNCATLGAEPVREAAYLLERACANGARPEADKGLAVLDPLLDQLADKLSTLS